MLLARWLGPNDYGRLSFLIAIFVAFKQFTDMATSEAFYTLVSRQQRSSRFIGIFLGWMLLQLSISLIIVYFLVPDTLAKSIWGDETRLLVILALIATFAQQSLWLNVSNMAESIRLSVFSQTLHTMIVASHLIFVCLLWFFDAVVIKYIFMASILEWTLGSFLLFRFFKYRVQSAGEIFFSNTQEQKDTLKSVILEFWEFGKYLIPYAWFGFFHDFLSRWMLQMWGSATEQAYFSIAQQVGAIPLLVTSSVLRIFWKEISQAQFENNSSRSMIFYTRACVSLYFISAAFAGCLVPWTEEIIFVLLGEEYYKAKVSMQLMLLYPVHQSLGIVMGTFLYATSRNKAQLILGCLFMVTSLVTSFTLIAPREIFSFGYELGALGLSLRYVLVNILFVNITGFVICKIFNWKFFWAYQIGFLTLNICIGVIVKTFVVSLIGSHFVAIVISFFLFGAITLFLVIRFPMLLAMTKSELNEHRKKLLEWFPREQEHRENK